MAVVAELGAVSSLCSRPFLFKHFQRNTSFTFYYPRFGPSNINFVCRKTIFTSVPAMGRLIDGVWHTDEQLTKISSDGSFVRSETTFRSWVKADGSSEFPAEAGRYHLYASLACPWANRATIFRKIKGLESVISLSYVDAYMGENGWSFGNEQEPVDTKDTLYGFTQLHQIYTKADPKYTGRVTVPVLWDKKKETIVSNESAELIRMLNSEFKALADPKSPDFYPVDLRDEIDKMNDQVYVAVNNGVYRAGFARAQAAYDEAVTKLFDMLDVLELHLASSKPDENGNRFLVGGRLTEADWRLFTTLIRFDAVYFGHFKCNKKQISQYDQLHRLMRFCYNYPGIKELINFDHIKRHYYQSQKHVNPTGIVPIGMPSI